MLNAFLRLIVSCFTSFTSSKSVEVEKHSASEIGTLTVERTRSVIG